MSASISTGSCANGMVMRGVDSTGAIRCTSKMDAGHCQNGEMLLGYDLQGNKICDSTVLKMLSCAQKGLIYAGEGSTGTDASRCRAPVFSGP